MEDGERKKIFLKRFGTWFSGQLSLKMILVLILLAALTWLISFYLLFSNLKTIAQKNHNQQIKSGSLHAKNAAALFVGPQGSNLSLISFLEENQLRCVVADAEGNCCFFYSPDSFSEEDSSFCVSTSKILPKAGLNGKDLKLYIWSNSPSMNSLESGLGGKLFAVLSLFNLGIFAFAGLALYLLIVSPIIRLRKTVQNYSVESNIPPRTPRSDEIGKLQNSFVDLTTALQAKEQSERNLIASISHDIKTPLTSVLGYSERLLSGPLSEEKMKNYLQHIHDKGIAIKTVVDVFDDYLDVGLKESAPMEAISAQSLCDHLLDEYSDELEDAGVTFSVLCACPEARIRCNGALMNRYFGNLISNSIKHAASASRKLELQVFCYQKEDRVILRFLDNGPGVPPDTIQKIFEPLYTSDRGRKVSGLGLSICKNIIQAHAGTVSAKNRPGGGLIVECRLPVRE